ncbi:MAG: hypothetical protein ACFN3C_00485, partial [Stomatobaculum longum]
MARKLKRQFVLVATSAVFAVLVLVLMLVNRMSYISLYENSMDTLELISYYGGALPGRIGSSEEEVELPHAARYFSVQYEQESAALTPVMSLGGNLSYQGRTEAGLAKLHDRIAYLFVLR